MSRVLQVMRQPCRVILFGGVRDLVSAMSVEDYVHDALHLVELDRIQRAGHLNMAIGLPLDLDGQARGTKIYQLEAVVADVVVIMCLDVA